MRCHRIDNQCGEYTLRSDEDSQHLASVSDSVLSHGVAIHPVEYVLQDVWLRCADPRGNVLSDTEWCTDSGGRHGVFDTGPSNESAVQYTGVHDLQLCVRHVERVHTIVRRRITDSCLLVSDFDRCSGRLGAVHRHTDHVAAVSDSGLSRLRLADRHIQCVFTVVWWWYADTHSTVFRLGQQQCAGGSVLYSDEAEYNTVVQHSSVCHLPMGHRSVGSVFQSMRIGPPIPCRGMRQSGDNDHCTGSQLSICRRSTHKFTTL